MKSTAILDSYWIIPGKLLAGEYPGAQDEQEARERLRWLLEQGVSAWLDLTEDGDEGLRPYAELLAEEATQLGKIACHTRLAIPDFSTPTPGHMERILGQLDELLDEGQTIYLHCFGGIGRTGMTVGCFLVRHGWDGEAALDQIAEWRKDIPTGWRSSPETDEQVRFVLNWVHGESTQRKPILGVPISGSAP
jgi:protein-tyrosine phosphatase